MSVATNQLLTGVARERESIRLADASNRTLLAKDQFGADRKFDVSALGSVLSTQPGYFRTTLGDVARLNASAFYGAVGYAGKRVAVDISGNVWKLIEGGAGWEQVATAAFAGMANFSEFFVDSRGYIYCGSATTGQNMVYRSVDDGTTWTTPLTFPLTTDSLAPMAEDELGNLYVGTYGSLGAGSNSCKFYKSTDGGGNWSDLTANLPSVPARHIHGCWWDRHRSLLFITHGDAGASSRIFVSSDRGASFSTWTASAQATAMAFTPEYIFYTADQSTDRGVYRSSGANLAAVIASTPSRVFDWRIDGSQSSSGGGAGTGNGFAWWGGVENGVVFFPFGSEGTRAALLASADNGETWFEMETKATAGNLFQERVYVSQFHPTRDGFIYGRESGSTRTYQIGLFAPGTEVKIDKASTSRGSGVVSARGEPLAWGVRSAGIQQRLVSPYAASLVLGPYVSLRSDGFQCGAVGSRAAIYHNFDEVTAPTLPSGITASTSGAAGVAVVTSAAQKVSGANSLLSSTSGAGTGESTFRLTTSPFTLSDGAEAWVSFSALYSGTIDSVVTDFFQCNSIRAAMQVTDGVKTVRIRNSSLSVQLSNAKSTDYVVIPDASSAWFRFKIGVVFSPNTAGNRQGRVRAWVDIGAGWRLICDAIGVPTYSSLSGNAFIGLNVTGAAAAANLYIDDVRWGTSDPDHLPAITLAQTPSAVPDLGMAL